MADDATAPRRVLVVDDDADTLAMTADALGDRYHVATAATVAEALACAVSERPAAIVLDLMLAGESGWDLVRSFGDDVALRSVPIVVLSATPATEPPAGVGGWVAYLTKSCPMARLREVLAALLGWSQGTFAHKLELGEASANIEREIDGGLQTVEVKLPTVMTVDLRLNEPRYASLPNIMKAKKKPIDEKSPADYGVDIAPKLKVLKVSEPPKRQAGIKVKTVAELLDKLKNEAGVI